MGFSRNRLVFLAPLVFLLSGCDIEDDLRFGWPRGITPQAEEMRQLWTWSVVAALVVGVFVWGLIIWCMARYRRRGEDLPAQTRYNLPIEILYSVLPFLIVAVLFYYTAVTQTSVNALEAKPQITVTVTGFKWNWKFEYNGVNDPEGHTVATIGTTEEIPVLVLPTGKLVRFDLVGTDVIHSFWVPELLFKRDVIPGHGNAFQVTIEKTGAYEGRCAELCGTYHSQMNFELRVLKPNDYEKYLQARQEGMSNAEALESIGQEGHATSTRPFDPDRTKRSAS